LFADVGIHIDDPADPRIADYRNIPDAELIQRRGIFIAEGRLVVRRLLESTRLTTRSVMVTPTAHHAIEDAAGRRPDVPVFIVPQALIDTIAGINIHRGCLAIGERPAAPDSAALLRHARRIIILERVANADNVGAIFRSAAAFGVDAVLLDSSSTDPLYRKAIRTSMAAALSVPFSRLTPWPDALKAVHDSGLVTIAMTPSPHARPLHECAIELRDRRLALVVGHEGEGLTDAALGACDYRARIPMAPGPDSLNVATATAIGLYEIARSGSGIVGRGSAR
jgi:tRNA G18 (ribose-2'-O)-methylase SpoU